MVSKIKKSKNNISKEKALFITLLFVYIVGVLTGSFFILSNSENANFANYVIKLNSFKILMFFPAAFILKYSGILSGAVCILPMIMGIQNSAYYCNYILNSDNKIIYETVLTALKDAAVVMLFIMYLIVIIFQILHKKYNTKKDIRYFLLYFIGAVLVFVSEFILKFLIF